MATGTISPFVKLQFCDDNGDPLAGAQLFIYDAGTTTKATTYTDVNLSVPNTNPIVLDSAGRCVIFLEAGSFKYVMAPSTDTDPPTSAYWTVDGVGSVPAAEVDTDVTGTAGEDILAGDAVYLSDGSGGQTAGRWYKTDASDQYSSSAAGMVGMAQAAISSGVAGSIRLSGRITGLSGLTAGSVYYADATPGVLTLSPPTFARQIGMADTITSLIVGQGIPFATATTPGLVSATTQTIAGAKTFNSPPNYLAGGATGATTVVSGVMSSQSGFVGTTGATEDDLFTFTLPGNTLATDGQAIRVSGLCTFAANGNTKVLRAYYGTAALAIVDAAVNVASAQGVYEFIIIRTGVGTQLLHGSCGVSAQGAAGNIYADSFNGTQDETTDLVIKLTGQGTADDDVGAYNFLVEVLGF